MRSTMFLISMPELSVEAQKKVDKLKKAYLNSFPEKLNQLQLLWERTENKGYLEGDLNELAAFCHKLAGSSGSYGLLEISQAARSIEQYCHDGFSSVGLNKASIDELRALYINLVKRLVM